MNWNSSTLESLRRVFTEGFVARDIAEPLVSFDASIAAAEVLALVENRNFDVVGVRKEGTVIGYVERTDLCVATCGENVRPINGATMISETASMADVVLGLVDSPRLFVKFLGTVGGIITMSDLQKPPVRMWAFGMITLIEMRVSRLIELKCKGDSWKQYLSESRLQKAEALMEERRRRNQDIELIDCLQISDKGQIIARNEDIRRMTRMQSRRQAEQTIKMLESLRNNLAHSQDIISCDWETIVVLCRDMERVISGTEEVQQALGSSNDAYSNSVS
ncbi:MAG: hypothetical protein WCB27_02385 [Thermoguttaceae bacterium]